MKNAMKKLTSLLLVAVLLVGAIPFAALAAEDEISFASSSEVAAASVEPAAETPAPAANAEGEVSFSSSTPVAQTQEEPNNQFVVAVVYNAPADAGIQTGTINSKVEPGKAWKIARELQGKTAAAWTALGEKYDIAYTDAAGNAITDIDKSVSTFTVTLTEKVVPEVKYLVTVKIDGFDTLSGDMAILKGTTLTLDASLLTKAGVAMPAGHTINMFKEVVGGNVGDVISGTYTVNKDVEIRVITVPSESANNGGTTGGTTGGNAGTGSNGTTGGTTAGAYTVTFYDYDGKTVLHTATTTANGKLAAIDVNYAAKSVNAPSGYTFSDRWKKNNTGDSIATSTIISDITITADTAFVPVFTAVKTDIVTSTKNQNDIILNIFVNKDFNNCKTVKLNDHWVISDNKITTYEILNYVVTDYYKASNSNLGLQCDGLYYSVGSFMYNWLLDNAAVKTDSIDNIDVKRANGVVTINVMVTNAVAKTSTAVASDNPKTGDNIYTAMTVMGLSAATLAAVMFFYNKKRYTV